MTQLTDRIRRAMYDPETDEAVVTLLTMERDDWVAPIRLANAGVDIVHQGETFGSMAFAITPPDDEERTQPALQLVADNTSLELMDELQSSINEIRAEAVFILLREPDAAFFRHAGEIAEFEFDEREIVAQITVEGILERPLVQLRFIPSHFPGLF